MLKSHHGRARMDSIRKGPIQALVHVIASRIWHSSVLKIEGEGSRLTEKWISLCLKSQLRGFAQTPIINSVIDSSETGFFFIILCLERDGGHVGDRWCPPYFAEDRCEKMLITKRHGQCSGFYCPQVLVFRLRATDIWIALVFHSVAILHFFCVMPMQSNNSNLTFRCQLFTSTKDLTFK